MADGSNSQDPRRRREVEQHTQDAQNESSKPRCFVVAPIGQTGTDARKRSDQILKHIIEPVVTSLGYDRPLRADHIAESGRITRQVIQHLVEDELVIADLTDSNPNVYYELALRHALRKPFVQLLAGDDSLPFDVADQRTIMLDHRDLDSVAQAKEELRRQVQVFQGGEGEVEVDTPLQFALDIASLQSSADPGDRTQAELLEMLQELRRMTRLSAATAARMHPNILADIQALRGYVERTVADGNVVDEDVDALETENTSGPHDEWVEKVVRTRMNSFLPVRREDDGAPTPDNVPF